MITWWIAQLAVLGTLLAIAAYGAEAATKVARLPTRWAWVAALGMTIALGLLAPTRLATTANGARVWQATGTAEAAPLRVAESTLRSTLSTLWHDTTTALADIVQQAWSVWHSVMPQAIERWLLLAWLTTSAIAVVAFMAIHWQLQRKRMRWPRGELRGTPVRITTDTGPAVIGVTSTEIVVPQWLLTRDHREQELVLEHESEHVRMHDPLVLLIAQIAVVLVPWHPAVWWMASRLRIAVELDCDQRVLQRGASTRDYGTLLIDLTDHRAGFGAALPAFSCSPSHLERRLIAMTPTRLKYPLLRGISTAAIASLAVLAACEAKLPTSDDVDRMTASTATTAAGRVQMIDTNTVRYFVDGVPVSKAEATKLDAERIASVNVLQKGSQSGGEVHIVTRNFAPGDSSSPTRMNYTRTDASAARVTFVTPGDTVSMVADTIRVERGLSTGIRMIDGIGTPSTPPTPPTPPTAPTRTGFTGLMIVDGVITDAAVANSIAPDQIVSVDVIKGAAATAQYTDPRAVNGVIKIATKKGKR
jgi:beta-lactamase regulating signal transducer with metallopeptidase domain